MSSSLDDEQQKWERYYASVSADDVLRDGAEVYAEVADAMASLLPPDARVLEAACGSGRHSAELARRCDCAVSLIDFSPNAIACAKRVFEKCGVTGHFDVGDVFSAASDADQDLVFNSGVLEHYSFDQQVEFLKAMARRSRRHVLVIVPNRECYWYWVWRIQCAAKGAWPYGYEKPASSYREAIAAAGLHFQGTAYFGQVAAEWFARHVDGLSPEAAQLIGEIHRREIVPPAQRSYLVGFLATTTPTTSASAPFSTSADDVASAGDWPDRCVALAADALAGRVAAQMELTRLQHENSALGQQVAELSRVVANIAERPTALARLRQALRRLHRED